jgi:hypothetical protein
VACDDIPMYLVRIILINTDFYVIHFSYVLVDIQMYFLFRNINRYYIGNNAKNSIVIVYVGVFFLVVVHLAHVILILS